MAHKDYDRTLNRLIIILHKLWKDERPSINELAEEFQVSKRTIQRDIYQRLSVFHIDKDPKTGSFHFVEGHKLETLLIDQEMLALALSIPLTYGTNDKMRDVGHNILTKLLNKTYQTPYYIKPHCFEFIDMDSVRMDKLEEAIKHLHCIKVQLQNNIVKDVEPYKIIAYDGIWYLLAKDLSDGKTKNFFVHQISTVEFLNQNYGLTPSLLNIIENIHSPWFDDGHSFDVVIKVKPKIAHYFLLRKQLPSQEIIEMCEDGSLILSYHVTHDEEVDNLVKAWMPDIRVLEPQYFNQRILDELTQYIHENKIV